MGIKQIKAILKLLGVKLEKKLTSDDYVSDMGKKIEKYLFWPELHHAWEL